MICYVVGFALRGNPRSLFFPRRSGGGVTRDRGVRRRTRHESAASGGRSHVGRFSLGRKSVPLLNTFSVVVRLSSSSSFEGKSRSLARCCSLLFSSLPPMPPPPPLNHCTITSAAAARALPSLRRHEWYHLFQFCSCVQEMTGVYNTKIR